MAESICQGWVYAVADQPASSRADPNASNAIGAVGKIAGQEELVERLSNHAAHRAADAVQAVLDTSGDQTQD